MMRFGWLGWVSTICIVILALVLGWQSGTAANQPADIRLAVTSWPTAHLLFAGDHLGFFAGRNVRVSIVRVETYDDAMNAMLRGVVDAAAVPFSEPLLLGASGVPLTVVLTTDYSSGADGIVAAPGIATISDLRGKRVALQPGSFAGLLLDEALRRNSLTLDDVRLVPANSSEAARLFLLNEVDAVVTFDPFLGQALARPGSTVVFSSRETPGLLPNVIAMREEYAQSHRAEVTNFLAGWFDVLAYTDGSDIANREVLAVAAITVGVSLDDIRREFANLRVFSLADNRQAFAGGQLAQNAVRFLRFTETPAERPLDIRRLIDTSFVLEGLVDYQPRRR